MPDTAKKITATFTEADAYDLLAEIRSTRSHWLAVTGHTARTDHLGRTIEALEAALNGGTK